MGNGFPIAAVVTTPEIGEVLTRALHFNTFGGNPLSCAVGSAVLDVIKEDKLQENSHEVGTLFLEELAKMRDEYPVCILYPYVQYYLLDIILCYLSIGLIIFLQ